MISQNQILSVHAIIYNADGYRTQSGITVIDHGHAGIQIGGTLHREDEIEISETVIRSINARWMVYLR